MTKRSVYSDILPVFKNKNWFWGKKFKVKKFLKLQIHLLQHSACWPIDYEKYLPSAFGVLSNIINKIYFYVFAVNCAHISIYFLWTFYYNLNIAENTPLLDISFPLVQFLIFSYTTACMSYIYFRHEKCYEIVNFMNKHLKMRSAIGN